jgi:predicted AlkP superfamily phosphohydrolase/phosphomutase
MRLAAAFGGSLFVTGDHGVRPTWRVFRPNAALARAGLVALDRDGRIDLARTKALSPNGAWVSVNRTAWKGGIVPPAEERAVLAAAERALGDARDHRAERLVTRVWRAGDPAVDSLGAGGPAGGDLYYDVAPGVRWSAEATGAVHELSAPTGEHGFRPTESDMRTAFCAWGPAFPPHRIAPVRLIDVAPTVAEWLGIGAPADSRGRSVVKELLKRR